MGAYIDHADFEWEEELAYWFDGGDSFSEPMYFYNGSIVRIMLPNADVIVTQSDAKKVVATGLPINPQKQRMLDAIEEMKGLKSAQVYLEYWNKDLKSAVNRSNVPAWWYKDTNKILRTQYN